MDFDIINLLQLVLGGGVSVFVYWFLDIPVVDTFLSQVGTWIETYLNLSKRTAKYAAGALVSVLGCAAAHALLIWLGEATLPTTPVDVINTLGKYALVWLTANGAHAMTYPKS